MQPAVYAVIKTALFVEDKKEKDLSEIFVPILKEVLLSRDGISGHKTKFYLADVKSIVKPIAIIPDIGGLPNAYFLLKDCESWKEDIKNFLEFCQTVGDESGTDESS